MSISSCHSRKLIFTFYIILLTSSRIKGWDNNDLEIFDLVEEVNENFYDVLGVPKNALAGDIKKAYRKKSLILHPDKNQAPDAEQQFRKLVAVYEVLKDDEKREKYNSVLENGLPDWKQPVYYYRKARKLGLAELALVLGIILTIGHYLVMWAVYLERRLAMEDSFESKKKRDTKKTKKLNDEIDEHLLQYIQLIPKPRFLDLWPITFTIWLVRTFKCLPSNIRDWRERRRLQVEIKRLMEEEKIRYEEQFLEEKEQRKQKRKAKPQPKCDSVSIAVVSPVVYGMGNQPDELLKDEYKQSLKEGSWTEEDYIVLSKAYIRYPGGTTDRWEKIAEMVGRPVQEVTAKCKVMKGSFQMNLSASVQSVTKNSKNQIDISDEIISKQSPEIVNSETEDIGQQESKLRKRNKQTLTKKDPERTLMIGKSVDTQSESVTSSQSESNTVKVINLNQTSKGAIESVKVGSTLKNIGDNDDKNNVKIGDSLKEAEPDNWTQNQQVILERGLKQYPKGTEQRWEKISSLIPGKSKDECVARVKYLTELVKQRKQLQS